MDLTFFLV
jgi:hypothetical protein